MHHAHRQHEEAERLMREARLAADKAERIRRSLATGTSINALQLLPWILSGFSGPRALPAVGRWKMIDNLRRSLVAPASLLVLTLCAWLPWPHSLQAMLSLVVLLALPAFLPGLSLRLLPNTGIRFGSHIRLQASDLRMAILQTLWILAMLPDQAYRTLDAIGRTLVQIGRAHV